MLVGEAVSVLLFVVSFVKVYIKARLWKITHTSDKNLDERQLQLMLSSLKYSYSAFTIITLVIIYGFAVAQKALRPRGTLVVKSTYVGALHVDFSSIVVDEIRVIGSRCGPFLPAIDLLARGKVDPTPLISAHYQISSGLLAFEDAARSGIMKVLLSIN